MATAHHHLTLPRRRLAAGIIGAVLIPWSVSEARPVHEHLAVDPQGSVEIVDVAARPHQCPNLASALQEYPGHVPTEKAGSSSD